MTTEEKAKELVDKYSTLNYEWDGVTNYEWAKEGALIAVNEMLELNTIVPYGLYYLHIRDYLFEVKQEIEKL